VPEADNEGPSDAPSADPPPEEQAASDAAPGSGDGTYHDEVVESAVREATSVVPDAQNVSGRDHISETALALFGLGKVVLYTAGSGTPTWFYNAEERLWQIETAWDAPATEIEPVEPEAMATALDANPATMAIPYEASPFADQDLDSSTGRGADADG
jgi:hypothetical protein